MRTTKILSLVLALALCLGMFAGCSKEPTTPATPDPAPVTPAPTPSTPADPVTPPVEEVEIPVAELKSLSNKVYGEDYTALYYWMQDNEIEFTIADVVENEETGEAYIEIDGVYHTLGLDFLSRAMVYNTQVPEDGYWETEDDVYATWWRLYITRWNALLPEVPLYSNEYYDLYNAQIKGVQEYPTNPYWSPTSALIDWTSEKADGSIILGNSTELSGKFRFYTFGVSSGNAADNDINILINGLETVATTKEGGYVWNETVVKEQKTDDNEDGSRTYTITLHEDLKFSDGSAVTAKNYIARTLAFSTPVATQAAGRDHRAGLSFVGFDSFAAYNGSNAGESVGEGDAAVVATKEFSGIRLLGDYQFSVTVDPDNLPYFYAISYGGFTPYATALWLGEADIKDDGNGVYLTDEFYAKDGEKYTLADHLYASAWNKDNSYPYSGPYTIESWNEADKSVVLVKNPEFKGNYEGAQPGIERVIYKRVISETQMADFTSGGVDVIAGITGGDETNEAIALADANPDKYVYSHYSRAGYGKLGFRADFGPVQFTEVRQAIAYCMDRAKFAKDFTGGYGGVVDGPYYTGGWMYKAAVADGMILNAYATSVDSAIAVLEEGGWVYNADGSAYSGTGVRYKKIADADMLEQDKTFQSKDGAYKSVQVGSDWYMPLILNWYGTSDNPFTDLLVTGFMENDNIKTAGFLVQNTVGEFNPMLDELYQAPVYGYYGGTPLYNCFNFATSFSSAAYDYSYNLTIDPAEYDDYSAYYVKDLADAYWLK